MKAVRWLALALAFVVAGAGLANAQCEPTVWNLTAGQAKDVGSLTVTNDSTNLYVTYTLDWPGTTFGTLHLWVGNDLSNLPKNSQGIPVPGQFPYQYNATGMTTYTFTIPWASLNVVDAANLCATTPPTPLYVVAHAEVKNVDGEDETAFGGEEPGSGPRWWFYGEYLPCCEGGDYFFACDTAFGKGNYVFTTDKKSNPEKLPSLNLTKNRWGWAINLKTPGTYTYDIWAGAGLNNTANGTKVGSLSVNWTGTNATITYTLTSPAEAGEYHIYVGDTKPTTLAPGQYGNTAYFDPRVGSYSTTIPAADTGTDGIWIIAHAVVCVPIQE